MMVPPRELDIKRMVGARGSGSSLVQTHEGPNRIRGYPLSCFESEGDRADMGATLVELGD